MAEAEEWLRDLEDRMMEITVVEQNKLKKNKERKKERKIKKIV